MSGQTEGTTLPVAVVQLQSDADAHANAEAAGAAIAGADPARLVLLPEYTSGWAKKLSPDLAQSPESHFTSTVRSAAAHAGRTVVVGTMEPDDDAAPRCANVARVVGPDGRDVGSYRKVHLFDAYGITESDTLVAGPAGTEHALVFDVGPLRVGVATCYDLRFPEIFRVLADAGANVFAVGAAWAAGEGKADLLLTLARARAIENTSYVLIASQPGPGRSGHSAIIDPTGVVLAQAGADEQRTLHAELDPQVVRTARTRVPSLRHRRYRVVPA
ncbi:MAG TPA: nitrilase-related carbon-nitrogen hydrolase [Beutenbergiaceae bacterium]|nr:nitrilase-related carbon-nitrogen hydrolase [Beutenbergiaceae bacterium]